MNQKYQLQFISRENLKTCLKEVYNSYREIFVSQDLKKFNRNKIDSLQILIESIFLGKDLERVIEGEIIRQQNKACSNKLGELHEKILHHIDPKWEKPKKVWDLVNTKQQIYVEIKTKHNTMNSSSSQRTYQRMEKKIKQEPQVQCYLVEIIAEKTQNEAWLISFGEKKSKNERIRRISIDKFYEIITGDKQAFFKLIITLPQILKEIVKEERTIQTGENTVLSELEKQNPNHLLSLFNLSFQQYEGFRKFLEENKEAFEN